MSERHPDQELSARPPAGRRGMPAGRVLVVLLVTLLVWALLYAPELERSAEAHPMGARRSVSLAILRPLSWVSDTLGLTAATDAAAQAAGRDTEDEVGGGTGDVSGDVEALPPPPARATRRPPEPPPSIDTPIREPTGKRPLRVVVVGDSLAVGIGYFTERVFKPFFADVRRQGRISTGLARTDYFNWPAQMRYIVEAYRPDLTIVLLGENDNQALLTAGGEVEEQIGQPGWPVGYEERVERFASIASEGGGHVMWVGLPTVRDEDRWEFTQRQNAIFEAVADRFPNVGFFDSWELFEAGDGGYTPYYRDDGRVRLVRADDGLHFNSDGYTILMRQIMNSVVREFDLDRKTLQ